MAREKQLPLFDFEDDDDSKPRRARRFTSWEEVARDLGRLLKESRFERYLGEHEVQEDQDDGA